MRFYHYIITFFIFTLPSCSPSTWQSFLDNDQLSNEEVVAGLKTALDIGTDKAVGLVSLPDGYLKDQTIKIILPPEAEEALNSLRQAPGGEQIYQLTLSSIVEDLVVAINRSASDAAKEASPIFKNAIKSMSIQDGWLILKGDYKSAGDISATTYFKDKTYFQLSNLFAPKIDISLEKKIIGNASTNDIWNMFVSSYNKVARSPASLLMNIEPVKDPDLSTYVTNKALDGLFLKVSAEEQKIRKNPYDYANQIIEKVFGNNKNN